MADRLDAVNASFEDCEEQDDDVEIMQTEETAPIQIIHMLILLEHISQYLQKMEYHMSMFLDHLCGHM